MILKKQVKYTVQENIIISLESQDDKDNYLDDIKKRTDNIIKYIGIPSKYLDMKIRILEEELLEQYICNDKGLYIWGTPGTGKTAFACILLSELMKMYPYRYKCPKFLDMRAIKYELEHQYQLSKTIKDIIDIYIDKTLLIIDDFGTMTGSESYIQFISHVINSREQNSKRTIITSNKDLNWISSNIDDRISSRITGMCDIIKYRGQDERMKNTKTMEIII